MAKKVTIIGATGSIGRAVRPYLLENSDAELTLFSRSAARIGGLEAGRERVVEGDVYDEAALDKAVAGADAVLVALTGDLGSMAEAVVASMHRTGADRLLFISSMGIYDEIPAWGASGNLSRNPVLGSYREAADIVEASGLNYTVIRPGWYTNGPVDYEMTRKGEPFGGHDVSRESIADLVLHLVEDPDMHSHDSVGINTPNSR